MGLSFSTYPDKVHKEAQHIIGEEHHDNPGDKWAYVEFTPGTYENGIVVRDAKSSDLVGNSGVGTVTAASAIDSILLTDTGEFANKDLRGAIGTIYEGAGAGQSFFVKKVRDANTIEIRLLKSGGAGWETAITTASKYRLFLPGRVYIAAAASENKIRGVVPYKSFTVPTGEFRYGYVRKTGIGEGLVDGDDTAMSGNGQVTVTTGGKIIGAANTLAGVRSAIGECANGDSGVTADALMLIDFRIINNRRSLRRPKLRETPTLTVE